MAERGTGEQSLDLIEIVQAYPDGIKVRKRGVEATPGVIRQHQLAPDEVMAFSCCAGRGRAITAFHFHPDFPMERRRAYMRLHDEGRALATAERTEAQATRRRRRDAILNVAEEWRARAGTRGFGRIAAVAALVLAVLAQIGQFGPPR